MRLTLHIYHPTQAWRRAYTPELELPEAPQGPMPGLPSIAALREAIRDAFGIEPWILSLRGHQSLICALVDTEPSPDAEWVPALCPESRAPWAQPDWLQEVRRWIGDAVGPHSLEQHRVWGRCTVLKVRTSSELLWFKQSYGLAPGEGEAIRLAHDTFSNHPGVSAPEWVALEGPRALMRPLRGVPLLQAPRERWGQALQLLTRALRPAPTQPWLRAGCRDRGRDDMPSRLTQLYSAYGVPTTTLERHFERFEQLSAWPNALLPQDLGPCNLRWTDQGVQTFDWSDVLIGPPAMLLDRFLNGCEVPDVREEMVNAWQQAWGAGAEELWQATRRCALLLEALRFHEELQWLDPDAPLAKRLKTANRKQLLRQLEADQNAGA